MTHEQKGNYRGKHPAGEQKSPELVRAVRSRADGEEISCAAAFSIARDLGVDPGEVGKTIDLEEVNIVRCQLGLFGYGDRRRIVEPAKTVSPDLERALRDGLDAGKLPCAAAWKIADRLGIEKMAVSRACEALGLKISACQLGAF